jgi:hypothetical protein
MNISSSSYFFSSLRKEETVSKQDNLETAFKSKLTLIKNQEKTHNLYSKLVKIEEHVSLEYANKYLDCFLENEGITFNELICKAG